MVEERQVKMSRTIRGAENRHAPLSGEEILAIHQGVEHDWLQWLPDSSSIVFRTRITGTSDFWSIAPDGGGPTRLTIESKGSKPSVSPDGKWLAYLSTKSGESEIWLCPLTPNLGSEDRQLTRLHGTIGTYNWAPDCRSIVLSCNQLGRFDIIEVSVPDGKATRLTSDERRNEHYPVYAPDGKSIYFVRMNETWTDHDVIEMDRDGQNQSLVVRETDFFDYRGGRQIGHPLISPDGERLLFRSRRDNWINYWQVDLSAPRGEDGAAPTPLRAEEAPHAAESGSMSAGEAVWSPDGLHVAYVSNRDGNMQLHVIARDGDEPAVVAAPERGVATHPAWSPDGKRLAFLYESFTQPPDVWVVDIDGRNDAIAASTPVQLTHSMPENLSRKLDPPEKVKYTSFDGTIISAYVYRPKNQTGEPGPAIIEVHGGPPDQFRDTMHLVVQFYVQRGYTVLMANIRGSAGYGKKFEHAIRTGWGRDDLKDLIAGAEYLVKEGLADPDRIGITGQSYGGFLSMAAACLAPRGTFQASISRSGYADWYHYHQNSDSETTRLLEYSLGSLPEHKEHYIRSSPFHFAAGATTPILVIDQDSSPTERQVDRRVDFVRELKKFGKPATYKKYRDTGGPYARSDSAAKEMLPDMIRYFQKYLG